MSGASLPGDDIGTRQVVLDLIVEKGPITAATLAVILDLTPAAVRRHLIALESDEQITTYLRNQNGSRGRGRPARYYVATDAGRATQPEQYSVLARKALDFMVKELGESAVRDFAKSRSNEIARRYSPVVHAAGNSRAAKVRALADALADDGYAATVRENSSGLALQLCQGNCPVQEVAKVYPQICEAETEAFGKLLEVHVQRLATLADGEHVCTTNVPVTVPVPRVHGRGVNTSSKRVREGN